MFKIVLRALIEEIVLRGLKTLNDLKEDNRTPFSYEELHPIMNYPLLSKHWEQLSIQGLSNQPLIIITKSKIFQISRK